MICMWLVVAICLAPILPARADGGTALTVLAPPSLTEVMAEVSRAYARKADISVSIVFGASSRQSASIVEGQPADILLTEDMRVMKDLRHRGLIDVYAQTALYPLDILLVASHPLPEEQVSEHADMAILPAEPYREDQQLPWLGGVPQQTVERAPEDEQAYRDHIISKYKTLRKWLMTRPLIMPDPWLSALGRETVNLMRQLHAPARMGDGIQTVAHPRAVLRSLLQKPAVGAVYAQDMQNFLTEEERQKLTVVATPPTSIYQQPVVYMVVVAGEYMAEARKLAEFIRSEEGAAIFRRHGFEQ